MVATAQPAKAYADTQVTAGSTALEQGAIYKLKSDFDGTVNISAKPIAGATSYQYLLATNKKFKGSQTLSITSTEGIFYKKLTSKGYQGFKNGMTLYVKTRAVNTSTGAAGAWSKAKKVKIKNKTHARAKAKLKGTWQLTTNPAVFLTLNKNGTGSFIIGTNKIGVGWCASSATKGKATLLTAQPGSGKVSVSKNGKTLVLKDASTVMKFKRVK